MVGEFLLDVLGELDQDGKTDPGGGLAILRIELAVVDDLDAFCDDVADKGIEVANEFVNLGFGA